tara:strand:- start:1660 stop:1854 length:195 start_codon:yes stop_codon:yes gene_type:complete
MITYKIKQASLEPDKYGNHIKVKMMTKYKDGKFVKHIKLDDDAIRILTYGLIVRDEGSKDAVSM